MTKQVTSEDEKRGISATPGWEKLPAGITHSPSQKGLPNPACSDMWPSGLSLLWLAGHTPLVLTTICHSWEDSSRNGFHFTEGHGIGLQCCHLTVKCCRAQGKPRIRAAARGPGGCWASWLPRAEKQGDCDLQVIANTAKTAHGLWMCCHASYSHNLANRAVLDKAHETNQKTPHYQSD